MRIQKSPAAGAEEALPFDLEGVRIGLCRLAPGETFPNHFHEHHEEIFFVIKGSAELWIDQTSCHRLEVGDIAVCERTEEHLLRHPATEPFLAYFAKTPNLPDDRVLVP